LEYKLISKAEFKGKVILNQITIKIRVLIQEIGLKENKILEINL
jgi:hypothetical protein